jgi:hypothetical protein
LTFFSLSLLAFSRLLGQAFDGLDRFGGKVLEVSAEVLELLGKILSRVGSDFDLFLE